LLKNINRLQYTISPASAYMRPAAAEARMKHSPAHCNDAARNFSTLPGVQTMKKLASIIAISALTGLSSAVIAADGQQIYQSSCQACHATGAAGAPKLGDKEAWAPRIAQGADTMLANATNGIRAMPPKGACATCTEDDLKAAIDYMVSESQ
jgi:cytochrome c5